MEPNGGIHLNGTTTTTTPTTKQSALQPEEIVRINVCGTIYQPMKKTLAQFPTTLLGCDDKLHFYYVEFMDAYYFDRHRECFEAILYYFQVSFLLLLICLSCPLVRQSVVRIDHGLLYTEISDLSFSELESFQP